MAGFFYPLEVVVPEPRPVPAPPKDRVTVLIDYENVTRTASRVFATKGAHVMPRQVAQLIVDRRKRPSQLQQVRVYRGKPNPHHQPVSAAASSRQAAEWVADRVYVEQRNLFYPDEWPEQAAMEKGIDVALAVDAVRLIALKLTDVVVIFSHDNDLLPAIETVIDLPHGHVEVAAWQYAHRLRDESNRPWCHHLSEQDFANTRDHTDYTLSVEG